MQIGGLYGACADGYRDFVTKWADVLNEDMTTEQVRPRPPHVPRTYSVATAI